MQLPFKVNARVASLRGTGTRLAQQGRPAHRIQKAEAKTAHLAILALFPAFDTHGPRSKF